MKARDEGRARSRRQARRHGEPPAPPAPVAASARAGSATRLLGPACVAAAFVGMLAWTWRTWPDPIVDYGRELYVAWQVASGRTLYADVVHFFGPLSVHLNALAFRLFGTSLLTLALWNAAIAAAFVAVLYAFVARLSSRLAATAAGVVVVTIFAFGRFTRIGNYNWVCPYAHELVHGAMLAIVALAALDRHARTGRPGWMAAAGGAAGLLVLTKVEPLLAGAAALAIALPLTLATAGVSPRRAARLAGVFAAGAALPLALAFAGFATRLPPAEVLRWPLGHWSVVGQPEFAANPFYRSGMGMDDVPGNLAKLATAALWGLAVLGPAAGAAMALRTTRLPAGATAGIGLATAGILVALVSIDGWLAAARMLPLVAALAAAAALAELVRRRGEPERARLLVARAAFAVFALVLLAKMILNARVFHYGFVLAMPAAVVLVMAVVDWLPAAVTRRGGQGAVVQAVALGALVAGIAGHLAFEQRLLRPLVHRVASGDDAFYADGRAVLVNQVLHELRTRAAPGDTLAVVPEGAMMNFLLRRRNPTPFPIHDSTSRVLWGEARMAQALAEGAPEWIVVLDRGNRPRGAKVFGQDQYRDTYAWIRAHYAAVVQLGAPPLEGPRPGATVMRRAAPAP